MPFPTTDNLADLDTLYRRRLDEINQSFAHHMICVFRHSLASHAPAVEVTIGAFGLLVDGEHWHGATTGALAEALLTIDLAILDTPIPNRYFVGAVLTELEVAHG
jgi:hypothetical protein